MNKKNLIILAIILIALIASASAYAAYTELYVAKSPSSSPTPTASPTSSPTQSPIITPSPTPNPYATSSPIPTNTPIPTATPLPTATPSPTATPAPTSVTVTDGNNDTMTIQLPVTRIVSLTDETTEDLCLMGCQSLIVGVSADSTTPPSITSLPVLTSASEGDYEPNVEEVIALQPQVVFADSMLPYNTASYNQLLSAGIAVYIVDNTVDLPVNPSTMNATQLAAMPSIIDFACNLMQNMVPIVGHQAQVTAYVNWAQSYNTLVKNRIATLPQSQEVSVFLEWYTYPYNTFVTQSCYQAGAYNIAENSSVYSPVLSPEFVVAQNPTAIIEMIDSPTHNINDFIAARDATLAAPRTSKCDCNPE